MTPLEILRGFYAQVGGIVLLHTALLIPPKTLSKTKLALAFLPLIWSCHIYTWSVGLYFIAAIQALWATELLLFRSPREEFSLIHRRKSRSVSFANPDLDKKIDKDGKEKPEFSLVWREPYPSTFWKRFCWALKLQVSMRYVGWDLGDGKSTEKSALIVKKTSRFWLLVRNVLIVGVSLAVYDTTTLYQHYDPYFQIQTNIDEAFPRRLKLFLAKYGLGFLPPRMVRISVVGLQQYTSFVSMHTLMATICVGLGGVGVLGDFWGGMESWPLLMGSPFAVVSRGLAGFWGETWHQLFRNILTSPGRLLANCLGLIPKSLLANGVHVATAFFLSGALQAGTLPQGTVVNPLQYAAFFWIQGFCVVMEAIVDQAIRKRTGALRPLWLRSSLACSRLAWTVAILYYTAPVIVDELTRVSRTMGLRQTFLLSRLVK